MRFTGRLHYPDFAAFLVEQGIDSISLNPDSVVDVKRGVAEMENELRRAADTPESALSS